MQITYGNHELNFASMPEPSVKAMLSRGVTHFLGNEVHAKTGPNSSWAGKFEKENSRKPTDEEVEAQRETFRAEAIARLAAGTVGTARGPKLDPVEAEMDRIAEREVWDTLSGANLCKKNKKPKDDESFEFANGEKYSFEELVARRLEKHGDRIKTAAEKKVAAELKARKAAQEKAATAKENAGTGPVEADALGL